MCLAVSMSNRRLLTVRAAVRAIMPTPAIRPDSRTAYGIPTMPAPTMPLMRLKVAPGTVDLGSDTSFRFRRRLVPPGVVVVVWTTGVREDGAKKGESLPDEDEGVELAVVGVMRRLASASGRPRRDERTEDRRPIFTCIYFRSAYLVCRLLYTVMRPAKSYLLLSRHVSKDKGGCTSIRHGNRFASP